MNARIETKKENAKMSLFEQFVMQGHASAEWFVKEETDLDGGAMATIQAATVRRLSNMLLPFFAKWKIGTIVTNSCQNQNKSGRLLTEEGKKASITLNDLH